jgi:hypothetical protein
VKQVCPVRVEKCQFHNLRALLQQAEGYGLLKGWDASYRYSLIHGQAAGLVCDIIVEFPREVQTCNWTESHTVDLNCWVVAKFRGLLQTFPRLTGG